MPSSARLRGAEGPQGEQPDLAVAEEEQGIEIHAVAEQAPVQARDRAVAGSVLENTDHLSGDHGLTAPYGGPHGQVGRPEAAGVEHGHHTSSRQGPGVTDRPRPGGPDPGAGPRVEIDASVTGQPRLRRGCETPEHPWPPGDGPLPPWGRR
ncbi:hypothetical protein GCM10010517_18930 [Streptosporangium fragile]|uniref:Uncharacterized protein n=1 Tax=Streptosporangium fragile TaxID=46186 RepID=A0ABP6IA15_9ACTN